MYVKEIFSSCVVSERWVMTGGEGCRGSVIPIPNQSAIIVGFVIGSSAYNVYACKSLFLAALISSFIWNRNYSSRQRKGRRDDPILRVILFGL
ncbi:MAG: hypothetical protein NTY64_04715, partial [Deltaproteobacteria bacterium]|nr:hypothetical protein [Deltaproteobacteria bacterium]